MTDQAVDTEGTKRRPRQRPAAAAWSHWSLSSSAATRELKALRADIERAGLDTLAGRKAARAGCC